ncbi:unnamed protein product [Sphagnum troendelagicum]
MSSRCVVRNPLLQSDLHCPRTVLVASMIDLLTPATSPEMKFVHVGLFCCYRRSVDVVVAAENPCCSLVANTGFDCAKFVFLFVSFIDVSRQDRMRAAQKAAVGMNLLTSAMAAASPSLEEAVRSAMRLADEAVARNDIYCVVQINVGLDTNTLREAVMAIMNNQKDLAVMIFSVEEVKKLGAIVCAGVPQVAAKGGFRVLDWLHVALQPIDGATVFVKGAIAMGQSKSATSIDEALEMAINYAKHCQ